jgi:ABC-type dipeptide/oligopeptide/nickel transport system permease component
MDRIINSIAALGISVPNFFLGILIIWLFGVGFRLFSPGVFIDYRESLPGFLVSLFFPALAITLPNAAFLIKFLRNSMQQELSKDYVRTAFCKGAVFSRIIRHHILPNTLVPLLAIMGIILTEIFSGSIIIEQVFAIPGIGRLLISAIMSRDYPLIQSLVVYIAWTVTLIHAFIDIAVQIIDPRIRLGHSQVKETG